MSVRVAEWRSDDSSPSTMRRRVSSSRCFTKAFPHRSSSPQQEHSHEVRGDAEGLSNVLVAHVGVVTEHDRETRAGVELGKNATEGIAALELDDQQHRRG